MATSPGIFGLYFYRARNPVSGPEMDLNDSACRPDPDFDHGTIGLCRPLLRSKIARLARDYGHVDLLFYTYGDDNSTIRLVALMSVEQTFADHSSARASFPSALPTNLMVAGNQCLSGTSIDARRRLLQPPKLPRDCSCDRYVARADSVYIRFHLPTATILRDSPVMLTLQNLARLAPHGIGSRWPRGLDVGSFNRGVQNGAHWLRQPSEADAVRAYFLHGSTTAAGHRPTRGKRARARDPTAEQAPKMPTTAFTRRSGRSHSC